MKIKIHYRNQDVRKLYENAGVMTDGSAGFDLVTAEEVSFSEMGEFKLIDLGVVIQVPEGHHSLLLPRSSTFKKYKILQGNSVGLIDNDYCGKDDYWRMPAVYMGKETMVIPAGTRISQFLLQNTVEISQVEEFEPGDDSRGGFGSTGQ
jgi:dUTP pyrophosphatase